MPKLEGELGNLVGDMLLGMKLEANALKGYVTVAFRAPLCLLVVIAVAVSVLQLMRKSGIFAIPRIAEWTPAAAATLWIGFLGISMLMPGDGSLGIGWFCGLISALIPLVCLMAPEKKLES
jgi:hypothetical protein